MANRYWIDGSGNVADTAHWSATSGGISGVSVPGASDDVIFDINSGLANGTVTNNAFRTIKSLTSTTGVSYTLTGSNGFDIGGDIFLEAGMTIEVFIGSVVASGSKTLATNGAILEDFAMGDDVSLTGTLTLLDNLTITDQFFSQNGTFDANGYNVTANNVLLYSDIDYTPTIIMGGGIWTPGRSSWVLNENNGVTVTIIDPPWTKVTKPVISNYTNLNPVGKEQYDQPSIMYDDLNVFYDGVNPNQWTDVSKPVTPTWTSVNKPT